MSWDEKAAARLEGPALCAYASRLIGADPRLVLWGGGNSSIKTVERDHAGRETRVLWVKASGHDMKTIGADGFAPLRLDDLEALRARESMSDDEMVAYQLRSLLDPKASKPSIETLLHAWVPAPHVYHTHADDVAALTCTPLSRERTERAFGDGVLWIPYLRPGFELSKRVAEAVAASPRAWALVLDKHGALSWGSTAREAYEAMLRLVRGSRRNVRLPSDRPELRSSVSTKAAPASERRARALELLPWLRSEASRERRVVIRWDDSPDVLRFLSRPEAAALTQRGTFTMEHTLQTKARPLFWRPGPRSSLARAFEAYRRWHRGYQAAYAPAGTPPMDPNPRVVLVPGVGMFTTGKDLRAASIPAEIYRHTIAVIERVASFTRYAPLDLRGLGECEFWPLETYKLRLQPAEKEFSRKVAVVAGAADAVARAAARRFADAGAEVAEGAARGAVRAVSEAVLRFGGIDVVFSNAEPGLEGARAALRVFAAQGLGGAIVVRPARGVERGAIRALALEAEGWRVRVNAVEPADGGARVDRVADAALFLASERAGGTTAATLPVGGGRSESLP